MAVSNGDKNVSNMLMFVVKFLLPLIIAIAGAIIYVNGVAENEATAHSVTVEKTLSAKMEGNTKEIKSEVSNVKDDISEIKSSINKMGEQMTAVATKQAVIQDNITDINENVTKLHRRLKRDEGRAAATEPIIFTALRREEPIHDL